MDTWLTVEQIEQILAYTVGVTDLYDLRTYLNAAKDESDSVDGLIEVTILSGEVPLLIFNLREAHDLRAFVSELESA